MRIHLSILLFFCLLFENQEGLAQAFTLTATGESDNIHITYEPRGNIPSGVSVDQSGIVLNQEAAGAGLTLRIVGLGGDSWTFGKPGGSFFSISKSQVNNSTFLTQKLTFSPSIAQGDQDWSRALVINISRNGQNYRSHLPVRFKAPAVATVPEQIKPPVVTQESPKPSPQQSTQSPEESDCCGSPSPNKSCCPELNSGQEAERDETPSPQSEIVAPESPSDSLQNIEVKKLTPEEINILEIAARNPLFTGLGLLLLVLLLWGIFRKKQSSEEPISKTPEIEHVPQSIPTETVSQSEVFDDISFEETELTDNLSLPPIGSLPTLPEYIELDLEQHWEDTAVTQFWVHRDCVSDLDDTIRLPINRQKDKESAEDVPEIGGFLLGRFDAINEEQYVVSLEKFLPITPSAQNRYTVQFGDTAWMELEEAFKEYPGLKLVGWFHTHPGHGLFLSAADLREHKALFQSRHQVAMEIDPLTAELDLAVFTWTKAGDLNNQEQRKTSSWFSFIDDLDKPSRKSFEIPS